MIVERARAATIPERVSILGLEYKVGYASLDDCDGYIVPKKQTIVIDEDLSKEKAEQTYLHELVHGLLDQLGYLDLYEDEHLVQGLAIGLHQALWR